MQMLSEAAAAAELRTYMGKDPTDDLPTVGYHVPRWSRMSQYSRALRGWDDRARGFRVAPHLPPRPPFGRSECLRTHLLALAEAAGASLRPQFRYYTVYPIRGPPWRGSYGNMDKSKSVRGWPPDVGLVVSSARARFGLLRVGFRYSEVKRLISWESDFSSHSGVGAVCVRVTLTPIASRMSIRVWPLSPRRRERRLAGCPVGRGGASVEMKGTIGRCMGYKGRSPLGRSGIRGSAPRNTNFEFSYIFWSCLL